MRRFIELTKRFGRDERGNFIVIFGVMAIVLIATSGAVVDFTSMQQTRARAQTALDSAALALQPQIKTQTSAQLKVKAAAILTERLADPSLTVVVNSATINLSEGTLEITAHVTKPTAFVAMVGVPAITAVMVSQATRKQLNLEVAMVLDNSLSMSQSTPTRISSLKKAARCATNILFNAIADCADATLNAADGLAPTVSDVKIGIVPFTEFVNVGSNYKTASWMDQTGASARNRDGFDNDDNDANTFNTAVNRFTLYTNIGVTWSGCVEARNHTTGAGGLYYDTSDLTPAAGTPDSLFTPIFAPDQPDAGGYSNTYLSDTPAPACTRTAPKYIWTQVKTKCNKATTTSALYNSMTCSGGTTTDTYTQVSETGATTTVTSTRPTSIYYNPDPGANAYADAYSYTTPGTGTYKYTATRVRTWTYVFSDRELQERLCKYAAGNTVTLSGGFQSGPNADCGPSLQPLTATKSSIISKIAALAPAGGTNIHQGVMWGFHELSPTEPLTEAKVYDSTTSKVMIVMTDGENTAGNVTDWTGSTWYMAYGYPYSGRIAGADNAALQTEMDNRTKTTCTNAKAKDIIIYTVGLNPPNQTTKDMLTACATDATKAYFPLTSSDLVGVFKDIANQLAVLRLAK